MGFDAARGDSLTVENVPFFVPENRFAEDMAKIGTFESVQRVLWGMGPVLFIIFFFMVLVRTAACGVQPSPWIGPIWR